MDDPENDADLEYYEVSQKRSIGFWTQLGGGAFSFAILIHVIVLLIGGIWIFQIIHVPEKKIDFMPGGGGGGERGVSTKVETKKRAMITPTTNVKRVVAVGSQSAYSLPDPGDSFGDMATLPTLAGGGMSGGLGGAGSGKGFGAGSGDGMGNGKGMGKLFAMLDNTSLGKRCSKSDRLQRLKENGGTPECEDAVLKGLRWLKSTQLPNGSWTDKKNSTVAMTGIALLAYFGHCETPASEEFGDTVAKGIAYLVDYGMKHKYMLAMAANSQNQPYEHGIATYALAEAVTFCKQINFEIPNLVDVTEKAGQFIIDNQHDSGGWSYQYAKTKGHPDVSVVGWQVQALKACSHTTIKFNKMDPCIAKALAYLASCQNQETGAFGYNNTPNASTPYTALTGVGVLCYQMWDKGNGALIRKATKNIADLTTFDYKKSANLYAHYYESQAMMQRGGSEWNKYNKKFRDQVLSNQKEDGSWDPAITTKSFVTTPHFATCVCTLMLEVYYRFLSTGSVRTMARPGI